MLLRWIKGANIVLSYISLLQNQSIALSRGQYDKIFIKELGPAISTLIWSIKPLNLVQIQEFNTFIQTHISRDLYMDSMDGHNVDRDLKALFSN